MIFGATLFASFVHHMPFVYLSLGSNLGDKEKNLKKALRAMKERNFWIKKKSHIYKTEPVGNTNQDWFLNMCVLIDTRYSPTTLLVKCQEIETLLGRLPTAEKWGPRIIDIDILLYEDLIEPSAQPPFYCNLHTSATNGSSLLTVSSSDTASSRVRRFRSKCANFATKLGFAEGSIVDEPDLKIPHPRMAERRFVLEPLSEIAPLFKHPISGKTVHRLLVECSDESRVVFFKKSHENF